MPQTVSRRETGAVREKLEGSADAEQGGVTLEDFEDGTREWPRFKRTHLQDDCWKIRQRWPT